MLFFGGFLQTRFKQLHYSSLENVFKGITYSKVPLNETAITKSVEETVNCN